MGSFWVAWVPCSLWFATSVFVVYLCIRGGWYIWVFSFTSGLSGHGVVVCTVGLPLMSVPGGYGLASFEATLYPSPPRGAP